MRHMAQGQDQVWPIMSIQDAVAFTETHQEINSAQRAAIEQILTSRDTVQGLQGSAGVGKTVTGDNSQCGAEEARCCLMVRPDKYATTGATREC
jgi:AAA domain-containing protein